ADIVGHLFSEIWKHTCFRARKLLETSDGQKELSAARSLSPAFCRPFQTDWICLPFASHRNHIL
ncbi:hypothetical protein NQZ68_033048, partial [Dissostichus eleginoides]